MAVCISELIDNQGYYTPNSITVNECTEYVLLTVTEYNLISDIKGLHLNDAASFFSLGFGLILFGYLLGYVINIAKTLVNKI